MILFTTFVMMSAFALAESCSLTTCVDTFSTSYAVYFNFVSHGKNVAILSFWHEQNIICNIGARYENNCPATAINFLVLNNRIAGKWQNEERPDGFPFIPEVNTSIIVTPKQSAWHIVARAADEHFTYDFSYRSGSKPADVTCIVASTRDTSCPPALPIEPDTLSIGYHISNYSIGSVINVHATAPSDGDMTIDVVLGKPEDKEDLPVALKVKINFDDPEILLLSDREGVLVDEQSMNNPITPASNFTFQIVLQPTRYLLRVNGADLATYEHVIPLPSTPGNTTVWVTGVPTLEKIEVTEDCVVNYTIQPPTEFNCNPTGLPILLTCGVTPLNTSISWYYTSDPKKAGVEGTELTDGGEYSVMDNSNDEASLIQLAISVSNLTIGFYWCGVTSGYYRSSTITPICTHFNSTLPMCELININQDISNVHHIETECADIDSPTQFPRNPLPEKCIPVPSPTSIDIISKSSGSTILTVISSQSIHSSSPPLTTSSGLTISTVISSSHSIRHFFSSSFTTSSVSTTSIPAAAVVSEQHGVISGLIGMCVFLAVVTIITCGAFIIYCFLTRANGLRFVKETNSSPIELCSPVNGRSEDQLDQDPSIYSEVLDAPVIHHSNNYIEMPEQ